MSAKEKIMHHNAIHTVYSCCNACWECESQQYFSLYCLFKRISKAIATTFEGTIIGLTRVFMYPNSHFLAFVTQNHAIENVNL